MNYEDYRKALVQNEINKSAEPQINSAIRKAKKKLTDLRFQRAALSANKLVRKVSNVIPSRLKNKRILKSQQRVTVKINQPVYQKDKSRFFKEQWEEEKKQLFFY